MTSQTATVEALTAEVRVLMIGSRQVTMSVYGQLDHVNHDEIEPFGRVLPKDAQPGHIYVIGKRAGQGDLVSSWLPCTEDGTARWIAARSSARIYGSKAEAEDDRAEQCEEVAAELEKAAQNVTGDQWVTGNGSLGINSGNGAGHYDAAAARDDQAAEAADRAASVAEDEITRLDALADAARNRHLAACNRHRACDLRAEATAFNTRAQDYRTRAAAHQANAEAHWTSVSEWTVRDSRDKLAITETAAAWSALPLIVLAGLR